MARRYEDQVRCADVRIEWDNILYGLTKVRDSGNTSWRLEDIYHMCRSGEAYLYMFDGGFAICGRQQNHFNLEIELHLYAVYSTRRDSCAKFLPYFEDLAYEIGATSLTMESGNESFTSYGWEKDYIRYKRSL